MYGGDTQFMLSPVKPFVSMDMQSFSFSNGHSVLCFLQLQNNSHVFCGESYAIHTQKEAGPKVETVKATSFKKKDGYRARFSWQEILASSRVQQKSMSSCMHVQMASTSHLPLNGKSSWISSGKEGTVSTG